MPSTFEAHPPTRPRLGFDAIEKRRNFRGVFGVVSADRCPVATGIAQRSGLADVWESELLIWTESRYRELYLGDQLFPPGCRVHSGGDPP